VRGILAGSLTLIVIYVVVQPGASSKVQQGGNVLTGALQRLLSPGVAGVPQRAGAKPAKKPPASGFPDVPDRGYPNVPHNPQGYPL